VHDSYERLVDVACSPNQHIYKNGRPALRALQLSISDAREIGVDLERLAEAASLDEAISEFSRFYLERRELEVGCAGNDERKRRKLYDEFTPRFEASIVALEGKVSRELSARIEFDIDDGEGYEITVTVVPSAGSIVGLPPVGECSRTGKRVPKLCLAKCQASGAQVLRHLLAKSELSGREVLPEYTELCGVTRKRVVKDELAPSAVSGRMVIQGLLHKSDVSGKQAEQEYISRCSFTGAKALKSELCESEVSGRLYRMDQEARSELSGKKGHASEFLNCFETRQRLATAEAEQCEETGKFVRPGVLTRCEASGKRVLPSECGRCSVTNNQVLKRLLVNSSISGVPLLPEAAVRSALGQYCLPAETKLCIWTGQKYHPDDIGICVLTALPIHKDFLKLRGSQLTLTPLFELLNDTSRATAKQKFPILEAALSKVLGGQKCRMISGAISPTKSAMAVCAEAKSYLGLKTNYVGCVFLPDIRDVVGKVAIGKRTKQGWFQI
jgi:hypothetical protein